MHAPPSLNIASPLRREALQPERQRQVLRSSSKLRLPEKSISRYVSGSDNAKAKEGLFVNAKSHGLRVEAICPAGESKVGAPNLAWVWDGARPRIRSRKQAPLTLRAGAHHRTRASASYKATTTFHGFTFGRSLPQGSSLLEQEAWQYI